MSVLSSIQKRRRRSPNNVRIKSVGNHEEFISRIEKTLYYGKIPLTERFSLPVSELAAELYSEVKADHSLERLCIDEAAKVSRNACVSPCSLILALFYLERLKTCNPEYIERVTPSELFVVSMMVASKFLHDDGEEDEVFNDEWASSAGIEVKEINKYEKDFLNAIRWEVFVTENKFWNGLRNFERELAKRQGRRRGWFSYTELDGLLDLMDAWSLAQTVAVVSAVCLTSYTASVMTLVGSAMVASHLPGSLVFTPASVPIITPNVTTETDLNCILSNETFDATTSWNNLRFWLRDIDQNTSLEDKIEENLRFLESTDKVEVEFKSPGRFIAATYIPIDITVMQ